MKKCLPKHCKPCKLSSSKKVSTLAGTYTSTEIVIMRNLRLPEFDKNRYVDQQKALVFQSETCKYDVILQGSTDTCKWYFRVKTRHFRETQHKKGYTVQRAHNHIITDVQTTG
jgi:hypothetical protein